MARIITSASGSTSSFERIRNEALRRYREQTNVNLESAEARKDSGLVNLEDPKGELQSRLAELRRIQQGYGRLHNALDTTLDVLLVIKDTFGELGASLVRPISLLCMSVQSLTSSPK